MTLYDRLPVPTAARDLALIVAEFHGHCHRALELKPATILKLLERCDALRRPDRFERFLIACEADARGRAGLVERPYPQAAFLADARRVAAAVSADELLAAGFRGADIGTKLHDKRLDALTAFKTSYAQPA
jgi:tRNA nucleotidyltransferase (CCA-adding enzyme)